MSENLILNWARSLPSPCRRRLAAGVLANGGSSASFLLVAFAKGMGLSPAEVAGLLPDSLVHARVAADQLVVVAATPTTSSELDAI